MASAIFISHPRALNYTHGVRLRRGLEVLRVAGNRDSNNIFTVL